MDDILAAVASPQLWALVGQGLILMDYLQRRMEWNTRDWYVCVGWEAVCVLLGEGRRISMAS